MKRSLALACCIILCLTTFTIFGVSTQRSSAAGFAPALQGEGSKPKRNPSSVDNTALDSNAPQGTNSPLVGPVTVTATAGTLGPTDYATLKLAFDAINAGTHQGAIVIDIVSSTTEGATPATLNSNGAGSAAYTSVVIRPANDGVSISGNPVAGFGVIQLNGADNVTIDGDNPNTGGTNRNLTVSNTTTTTFIGDSAIRIATSAAVTSADNDTIKNCVLLGNVTAGNAAAITSTAGSSNSSFGVYVGGNGGATAIGAPTAITSVTTNTAPTGTTINGLLIDNNTVSQCARAIVFNGAVATVSTGVTISNNVIGDQGLTTPPVVPPYTAPATTVYTKGIWVAGTTAVTVSGNTLKNIMSYVGTTITSIELVSPVTASIILNNTATNIANNGTVSIVKAILVSSTTGVYFIAGNNVTNVQALASASGTDAIEVTAASTGGTIERNKVQTVYNRSTGTFGAFGINLTSGTGIVIRNNFVSDVNMDMTGGAAFSTQFSVHGIRIAGGTNHKVYHNSVNIFGALLGTATTSIMTSAFEITLTTITGVDVRNNIFSNTLTGGTTSIAHVSMFLPTNSTSPMTLTLNNNDYFSGADAARQGIAQAGTTAGTGFYLASDFNAGATTPATNLRALTTLLGPATNDNASQVVDPQFVSSTDLHIAVASPMVDAGASVGVGSDIDGQTRVPPPDIGADEPGGLTPVANDIAAVAIINPPNGSTRGTGSSFTPQASFTNNGTATQTNVPVRFKILDSMMVVVYNQTTTIPSITSGQTLTASFPSVMLSPAGTYTTQAIAELVGDQTPANDMVSGTVIIVDPLAAGAYTVGAGGNYPSLTNTGGIFEAINNAGVTGNITINITSDLSGETGVNALNAISGGFTVLIKPSGAARTISGTSTTTGLIKLNGADNVTIDGSTSGGLDRSLTITNGNLGATVIWIASASASDGANSNTVKNCIISGNTGATIIAGVLSGSGTTFGGDAETANSNNTIQNNQIFRVQNAAFLRGNGTALDQSWLVTGNDWGSTVAGDKLQFRGMLIGNAMGFFVTYNKINGISSTTTTSSTMSGIQVALVVSGGVITNNKISDVKQNNTTGWGSNGIYFTSSSAAANVFVYNNFISDVASQGFNGVADTDNGYGIVVATGGGYKIYFNSVLLNTNQGAGAAAGITAGINLLTGLAAGAVNLRDNILASTQTLGTRYGALCSSANTVFAAIDYNDYFAQNVGFIGGSAKPTLSDWQTGTGQDANSKAVDPLFVSSTAPADLHLQSGSTLRSMGLTLAGLPYDIDNDTRGVPPDIGADEFACNFVLSRNHQSFPWISGNGSVNVTASDPSCMWTATTSATYIHITSGTPGMGNGTLNYTIDANAGPGIRSDTITIAGLTYTVYQGIDFLDVAPNHLFFTDIGKLAARGVTLGCGSGNYCPNDPVLREQMAAFILRAKGEFNPPTPGSQRFTDVPPANVFYNFIDRLAVLGITLGCNPPANTMYCPGSAVTREQMSAFILRGLGEFSPPTPGSQRFNDVPPANVFYNFIDRMAVLNITLGCTPDHLFYCPSDPVTRAQMAAFLVRAFDL